MRATGWMVLLWMVSGCLDSGGGPGPDPAADGGGAAGGGDGGAGTGGDASDVPMDCADAADVCACEAIHQADLMRRAREAGCASDTDCVLLGSCDQGFGFVAVPQSFQQETQALIEATVCDWFDGPTYDAVCEAGSCVARDNGGACGVEDPPSP